MARSIDKIQESGNGECAQSSLFAQLSALEDRKLEKAEVSLQEIDAMVTNIAEEANNVIREALIKRFAKISGVKVSEISSAVTKRVRERMKAESKAQIKEWWGSLDLEVPSAYGLDENGVVLYGSKKDERLTTRAFWVNARVYNATEKREELELAWKTMTDVQTMILPRSVIYQPRELVKYSDQGLPLMPMSVGQLGSYIAEFDSENEVQLLKSQKLLSLRPGWVRLADGSLEFAAYAPRDKVIFKPSMEKVAEYLTSKGTLEGWLQLKPLIEKSPKLAFFMATSATAPLLEHIQASGFMVDMYGDSGTGKTTTQRVAASMWGLPGGQNGLGLVKPWKSTPAYMEEFLGFYSHMPVFCMDSQDIGSERTIEDMAYMVANGQGKGRATKDGGTRNRLDWKSVVISDGETPIYGRLTANGAQARIISVEGAGCSGLTAEDANRLEAILHDNYGHIAPRYIQQVKQAAAEIPDLYANARQYFSGKIKPEVQKRFGDYFAAILIAIELLGRVEGMEWLPEIALKETLKVFEQATTECIEEKTSKRVLQETADWVSAQRAMFITNNSATISVNGKALGMVKDREYVAILPSELKVFLADKCNVKSATMLYKEWSRDGILKTDKGINFKTIKFQGASAKMVVFEWSKLYPDAPNDAEGETPAPADGPSSTPPSSSTVLTNFSGLSVKTGRVLSVRQLRRKDEIFSYIDIDGLGGFTVEAQHDHVLDVVNQAIRGEDSPDQVTLYCSPQIDGSYYVKAATVLKGVPYDHA